MKYEVKEILPCEYSRVDNFSDGLAFVSRKAERGFIDKTGKMVLPYRKEWTIRSVYGLEHTNLHCFSEGLAAVRIDEKGKYGFIDRNGELVMPYQFDMVRKFHNGVSVVGIFDEKKTGCDGYPIVNWGVINKKGEVVIPFGKYQSIGCYGDDGGHGAFRYFGTANDDVDRFFMDGRASVLLHGSDKDPFKFGYVDTQGNEVISPMFNHAGGFVDGLAAVNVLDTKYGEYAGCGIIDLEGNFVVEPKYRSVYDFHGESVTIAYYWKPYECTYFLVDRKGKEVLSLKEYYVHRVSEGLCMISTSCKLPDDKPTKLGLMDISGKVVVPLKYDNISHFHNGMAIVHEGGGSWGYAGSKWGFIDKTGKEIIPLKYTNARPFNGGFAPVNLGRYRNSDTDNSQGKWGFIDMEGNEVIPCIYDEVEYFSEGIVAVRKGDITTGKWGFIEISKK